MKNLAILLSNFFLLLQVQLHAQVSISTTTNVFCNGVCNGTAQANGTGPAPITYSISPLNGNIDPNTGFATNLCAGFYTITATDGNSNTSTTNFSIQQPPMLTVSLASTNPPSCLPGCDGTAQLIAIGGVQPYYFSIAPNSANIDPFTGNASGLCANTIYTVVVTDGNSCSISTSITLNPPPSPTLTLSNIINTSCSTGCIGSVQTNTFGGTPPYTYSITPPGPTYMPNGFSNICPGNYYILATDANGCNVTTNIVMGGVANFSINSITTNIACNCSTTAQINMVPAGSYTYTVTPAMSTYVTGNTIGGLCTGIYTITATDGNGCLMTSVLNIPGMNSTSTSINPTCNGMNNGMISMYTVGGNPPYTYTLNNAPMGNTSVFTNLNAGTYVVGVSDVGLCSQTYTITLNQPAPFNLSISGDSILCGNHTDLIATNIGGLPPYQFTLLPGNITNSSGIFPLSLVNTYTINVADANGCSTSGTHTSVQVSNLLSANVTSTAYDESCIFSADGSIDLTVTPSAGNTYLWSNGSSNQDLTNVTSGNYSVLITDMNGDCTIWLDTIGVTGNNCGTISGTVFADNNSDCIFNGTDYYIINRQINLSTGDIAFTDPNGYYQFSNVPLGTHNLTEILPSNFFQNSCAQSSSVTLNSSNPNAINMNFIDSSGALIDENLYLIGTRYIPGVAPTWVGAWIKLETENSSPYSVQNKVTLLLSDSLVFNNSIPAPNNITSTPNGDSLTWFVTVPPYSAWWNNMGNEILVYLDAPSTLTMGSVLTSCATLTPLNYTDLNMQNNSDCISKVVSTSFDPNDKSVEPAGIGSNGAIGLQDKTLDYRIRFQNTGTAPAYNIYIMDTLSDKLDINTFKVLGFSHPYKIEIINGHILKFKFDNIMLPDSGTNMQASNGFIMYSIQQKSSNTIGTVIKNKAAIYFDYNSPIITNETINTIVNPTYSNSYTKELNELNIYPNPADYLIELRSNQNLEEITITDIESKIVFTQKNIQSKQIHIDIKHLSNGIYFVKTHAGMVKRFVVQR